METVNRSQLVRALYELYQKQEQGLCEDYTNPVDDASNLANDIFEIVNRNKEND